MTPFIDQLFRTLEVRGCGVRVKGGRLTARMAWGGSIPEDLAYLIRKYRDPLLEVLVEEERVAITTTNALSLNDTDFEAWCQEIDAAPVGDPELAHDREARRRAVAIKRAAQVAQEEAA